MSVKTSNMNEALMKIALDQGFETVGYDSSVYEDKTLDTERQYKIKVADYDKEQLLSKALGYTLDSNFETALNLQSKKPLYALQDVTFWGTKNEAEQLEITSAFDAENSIPPELRNKLSCYNRDIETISGRDRDKCYLRFIILLTEDENPISSKNISHISKELDSITYIFETEKNDGEKIYEMIKNRILNTDLINSRYYKIYTIANKTLINWEEENGTAKKYLKSCNGENIYGVVPIKFKTGKIKQRVGLLIDTQDEAIGSNVKLDIVELQKKIIAVQGLKPSAEQLKKDNSPDWIAKRVDFSKHGIVSEDLTLKDGESYYWDTAQCWIAKTSKALEKSDCRNEKWYWEIKPFLRGGTKYDSLEMDNGGKQTVEKLYPNETTDVIKFNDSSKIYTTNITPDIIAKNAYAVIVHDESFLHGDFNTTLQTNDGRAGKYPGIYFQNSQAKESVGEYGFTKDGKHQTYFIHQSDVSTYDEDKKTGEKHGNCFYNCQSETPNNGLLVEAKEKIFDVYFLTKESFTNSDEIQYDILESLKNGYEEVGPEGKKVKKYYYASKIKKWNDPNFTEKEFSESLALEEKAFEMNKEFLKEYENKLIADGVILKDQVITEKDIAENNNYNYLTPGKYYIYTKDIDLLTAEHKFTCEKIINGEKIKREFERKFEKEMAGCIYNPIVMEQKHLDPLKTMSRNEHFTYHEKNVFVKNGEGKLLQPEYLLSFGYNQEKITTFKEWELFKEKFAKFNKLAIPANILSNNKREIPWWKQEGEYVFLNSAFVNIFFQSASEKTEEKSVDLKPTKYDESDNFGLKFEITQEEINNINKKIKSGLKTTEFINNYIDKKVEGIFDSFFEMVCDVWGTIDSKGYARTKSYFLRDTPFEMSTEEDMHKEKPLKYGFDARILLDNIIQRSFCDVYDKDICEYIFKRLKDFFKKNKEIKLAFDKNTMSEGKDQNNVKANIEAMLNTVDYGFQDAIEASSYREFAEIPEEIKELKRIASINAVNQANFYANMKTMGVGIGVALSIAIGTILIANFTVVASVATVAAGAVGIISGAVGIGSGISAGIASIKLGLAGGATLAGTLVAAAFIAIVVVAVIAICYIIFKSGENKDAATLVSNDYVYKFTCRAKRALRQYSMTKRGPIIGEAKKIKKEVPDEDNPGKTKVVEYEYGDAEKRDCYYNWLAEFGSIVPEEAEYKWSLGNYKKGDNVEKFDPFDGRVMVIIPTTDEIIEKTPDKMSGSILQNIEEFIQTWMGKRSNGDKYSQTELPISGYYDMLTGMHPWIQIKLRTGLGTCGRKKFEDGYMFYNENGKPFLFKDEKIYYEPFIDEYGVFNKEKSKVLDSTTEAINLAKMNFKTLDSTNYPYFTSMSIADNGVKKLKLELFDPNFASYTEGIEVDKETKEVISLEALIRGAIRSPVFFQDETITKYSPDEDGKMKNDFLAIDESLVVSPTNLKVRFGYDDYDSIKRNTGTFGTSIGRDGRWYNTDKWGNTGDSFSLSKIKKYVIENEIKNKSGVWTDPPFAKKEVKKEEPESTETINQTSGVVMNSARSADIALVQHIRSYEQTTAKSRELDFMITGISSELKPDGIRYVIDAIESKDATIMRTRFLQRYAEITANPEETLYILMHMFNEDNDGNNVSGSKVKIILISDDNDTDVPIMRDKLNMEYEIKNIKEEDLDGTEATNIYEKAYQDEELEIKEELLKKITLTLGGASATKNYGVSSEMYKPLYKTLAQLLNEFCAACPPKKLLGKRELVTDENGNNVLSNQESTTARPLKWFSIEDTVNGITYVCLYYRTVMKVPRIRVYTWGPHNPTTSCVKSISIKNANEFGVLAGIRAFDGSKNRCISRLNNTTTTNDVGRIETQEKQKDYTSDSVKGKADYIGINADAYDNAYASSMYEGSMEILGDPFWSFDGIMQPCTYPIKLNIIMPKNDFTSKYEKSSDGKNNFKEQIQYLKNTFGEKATYKEGPGFADGTSYYDNSTTHVVETFKDNGNQLLHEMSGYYVVKTIEHMITPNDYTTRLGIMSYPNIQKDVILSKKEFDML